MSEKEIGCDGNANFSPSEEVVLTYMRDYSHKRMLETLSAVSSIFFTGLSVFALSDGNCTPIDAAWSVSGVSMSVLLGMYFVMDRKKVPRKMAHRLKEVLCKSDGMHSIVKLRDCSTSNMRHALEEGLLIANMNVSPLS